MNITIAGGHKITAEASKIAYSLGREIAQRRHTLITGGASGGDESVSRGAFDYLNTVGLDTNTYIKTIVPVNMEPVFLYGDVIRCGSTRYDRRLEIVEIADLIVLISGRKGTEDVYYAAIVGGKLVLPVGKTGGVAATKWEEFSRNLNRYYGERILLAEFENLNPATYHHETIAKWTVNLAEQLHCHKVENITGDTQTSSDRPNLRDLLNSRFNNNELRGLCFDLKIDWENLKGTTKTEKVIEILEYCTRHGMDKELVDYIRSKREDLKDLIPL